MADRLDTWNPGAYHRFRDFRLRPALDLLQAVGFVPGGGRVVDLGCGSGLVAPDLQARFGAERLIGVDRSAAMLDEARMGGCYSDLMHCDIADWAKQRRSAALIFSNAALHWLGDHERLFSMLAGLLVPGGWLAVQMPGQNDAPSHATWRSLTEQPGEAGIETPERYAAYLAPYGEVAVWETRYFLELPATPDRHPVRDFTQSTYGRPFLEKAVDRHALAAAYDAAMEQAYPRREDGTVMFPFRRVFCTVQRK